MIYDNLEWIESSGFTCTHICVDKDKGIIYKKYKKVDSLYDIYDIYTRVKKFDFVPRAEFDFNNNIIIEQYMNTPLNYHTKPINYEQQLLNIHDQLQSHNFYHNDYKLGIGFIPPYNKGKTHSHFFVDKYNNIILIDWNCFSIGITANPYSNNMSRIIFFCKYNMVCIYIITQLILISIISYCIYKLKCKN